MKILTLLLLANLIQSCSLSGGLAYHPSDLDSEFKDGNTLGFVQGDLEVIDNIYLYARHESIPFKSDRNAHRGGSGGVNSVGIFGKVEVFK